ncbi:MAG: hypothetical protein WBN92_19000 [Terriglobia bacterium]
MRQGVQFLQHRLMLLVIDVGRVAFLAPINGRAGSSFKGIEQNHQMKPYGLPSIQRQTLVLNMEPLQDYDS